MQSVEIAILDLEKYHVVLTVYKNTLLQIIVTFKWA
jgi:hypothetical protein